MQVRLRFVSTFLFVVLAVAPAVASATSGFDGDWSYFELDDDGVRFHGAELHLSERGHTVSGTWSDGSNQEAWSGMVSGVARNGQLHVRLCYDDGWGDESAPCPHFAPESDVFMRRGSKLVWYRVKDSRLDEYMTLERGTGPRSHKVAP
jgi:hypothetical protein